MNCPVCQKDTAQTYRPFCSKRCADLDLGRWFDGTYTIAPNTPDEDDPSQQNLPHSTPPKH